MSFIDQAVREASRQKREAWARYFAALHSTEEPSDDDHVTQLVEDIKSIGLAWAEVRSDESALTERRRLESQIAQDEKSIDDAQKIVAGNHELIAKMDRDQVNAKATDLSLDYRTPSLKIAEAQRDQAVAMARLENADERLRKLRIESHRAFNLFPEVSL